MTTNKIKLCVLNMNVH